MLSRATTFAARRSLATRSFTSTAPALGDQYDVVVVGRLVVAVIVVLQRWRIIRLISKREFHHLLNIFIL